MKQLRPYQERATEALRAARRAGHRRILLTCPTAGGKTVIACAIIARALSFGQRVLVIAHRKELLDQFWGELHVECGITAGVLRAKDDRTNELLPVQLASIATLVRRDLPPADLILIDEAHRTPGESYQRVLESYPQATVIGLTATPCRLDGQPLREHFDALVQAASYSELIDAGAIKAPVVYAARKRVDLSRVRKVAGDYNEGDLERVMRAPHVVGDVVSEWQAKAEGRSTVVFAVGIDHSIDLMRRFQDADVRAEHLDGSTPEKEREETLVRLELGKTRVVCNVGVLCEGWDQPRVKCLVMARPTLSLTLHMQTAGRILRPWGDLPPLILDHAGNCALHGLPHEDREWSLDSGVARRTGSTVYRLCPACFGYVHSAGACLLCGHVVERKVREVRTENGVLERIDRAIAQEHDDPKRKYFDRCAERARGEGFKPGYASAKYKEKFGSWPPWAWSHALLATYDDEWKAAVEKRTADREYWQKRNEERVRTLETAPIAEPEEERFGFDDL